MGSGLKAQGSRLRAEGSGQKAQGSGLRAQIPLSVQLSENEEHGELEGVDRTVPWGCKSPSWQNERRKDGDSDLK